MKSYLVLVLCGLLGLSSTTAFGQMRDFSAERIILDDGVGGKLVISYTGPGDAEFQIPPGGGTAVPLGLAAGQTLAWDGTQWQPMSNLMNNLGIVTVEGSTIGLPLFRTTNFGDGGGAALFRLMSAINDDPAVEAITEGTGPGIEAGSEDGPGGVFVSVSDIGLVAFSEESVAGLFLTIEEDNESPTLVGASNGLSNAAQFVIDNPLNDSAVVEVISYGTGPGVYAISSEDVALQGETDEGVGVWGYSTTNGEGGVFESEEGIGVLAASGAGIAGAFLNFEETNDEPALFAITGGISNVAEFILVNENSDSNAVEVYNFGNGAGVYAESVNGMGMWAFSEGNAAVFGESIDASGGAFESENGPGVVGLSLLGPAGLFLNEELTNDAPALIGATFGTSNAAEFFVANEDNDSNAVEIFNHGGGSALYAISEETTNPSPTIFAIHHGTSEAAEFMIDNPANDSFAVEAVTNGTGGAIMAQAPLGTAGLFNGAIGVHIEDGKLIGSQGGPADINKVIITLPDNGLGSAPVHFLNDFTGTEGQILFVVSLDTQGADVFTETPLILHTINPGSVGTFIFSGGRWHGAQ